MANTATIRIQDIQFDWIPGETYTFNIDKGLLREVGGNRLLSDTQTNVMSFTIPLTYGTLTNVSPMFNSTDIYLPKIELTYDRTVANNNTGSFYLYKVANPSDILVTTIAGTDTRVTAALSTATIDLSASYELFDASQQYYITSQPKAVTDIFNLQVETVDSSKVKFTYKDGPNLLNVTPASTSTGIFLPQIKLTYDRALVEVSTSSNYYLYRRDTNSDTLVATLNNSDPRVVTSGTTATINLSQSYDLFDPLKYYYITSDIGAIRDQFLLPIPAINNTSTAAFTYINNPQLQSVSPALGSTDIVLPSIQLTYDKKLNKGTTGTVNLYKISSPSNELVLSFPTSDARFIANNTTTAIINLTNEAVLFEGSQQYVVTVSNRAARDSVTYLWTNEINEGTIGFTYKSNPIILSANPANNSTGIKSPNISINTNRTMKKGATGNLYLYRVKTGGDVLKSTIPLTDSRVTTSSTWVKINLSANDTDFESGRTHYLTTDNRALLDTFELPLILDKNVYKFDYYLRENPYPITLSTSNNPIHKLSYPITYTVNQATGTDLGGVINIRRNGTIIASTSTWSPSNTATITVSPGLISTASSFSIQATWDDASTEAGEKLWASTGSNVITQAVTGTVTIVPLATPNVVSSSTSFLVTVDTDNPAPATVSLYRSTSLIATANTTGSQVTFNYSSLPVGNSNMRVIWNTVYSSSATNTCTQVIYAKNTSTLSLNVPSNVFYYYLPNGSINTASLTATTVLGASGYWPSTSGTLQISDQIDNLVTSTTVVNTGTYSLSIYVPPEALGTNKIYRATYLGDGFNSSSTSTTASIYISRAVPELTYSFPYFGPTETQKFIFPGENSAEVVVSARPEDVLTGNVTFLDIGYNEGNPLDINYVGTITNFTGSTSSIVLKTTPYFRIPNDPWVREVWNNDLNSWVNTQQGSINNNQYTLANIVSNYSGDATHEPISTILYKTLIARPLLPSVQGNSTVHTVNSQFVGESLSATIFDDSANTMYRAIGNNAYIYNGTLPAIKGQVEVFFMPTVISGQTVSYSGSSGWVVNPNNFQLNVTPASGYADYIDYQGHRVYGISQGGAYCGTININNGIQVENLIVLYSRLRQVTTAMASYNGSWSTPTITSIKGKWFFRYCNDKHYSGDYFDHNTSIRGFNATLVSGYNSIESRTFA